MLCTVGSATARHADSSHDSAWNAGGFHPRSSYSAHMPGLASGCKNRFTPRASRQRIHVWLDAHGSPVNGSPNVEPHMNAGSDMPNPILIVHASSKQNGPVFAALMSFASERSRICDSMDVIGVFVFTATTFARGSAGDRGAPL